MTDPAVTAVICNYNKHDDVVRAVASVLDSRNAAVKVLVVDNASTDRSIDALRSSFGDRIRILAQAQNTGGAGGFAAGMAEAARMVGEYVLLLDNDATIGADAVADLTRHLARYPDVGAVAPTICLAVERDIVQEAGGFIDAEHFTFRPGSAGKRVSEVPSSPFACDYVPFCAAMTRKNVIEQVGPPDPSYFLYWDDIDWSTRVRDAGLRIMVVPAARAWHRGGGTGSAGTEPRYYQWRNRLRFFRAHAARWDPVRFRTAMARETVQAISHSHMSGTPELVPAICQALSDAAAGVDGRLAPDVTLPRLAKSKLDHLRDALTPGGPYRLAVHAEGVDAQRLERQLVGLLDSDARGTLHVFDHVQTADWSRVRGGDIATDRYFNLYGRLTPRQSAALVADLVRAVSLLQGAFV